MEAALQEIESALKGASVEIYDEIQSHIGWTGDAIDSLCKSAAAQDKAKVVNASGDKVLALDMLADKHVEEALKACPLVAGFASEERDDFVTLSADGEYIVVFDPLDGSQNVPVGVSVGAIFGVFKAKHLNEVGTGDEIVAAGYALFSSALQFAFCTRKVPVQVSQYDFRYKEWVCFIEDHQRPSKGKTYAINEGNSANWDPTVSAFVANHLRGRSVRWACCMVLDVSRQLLQGGCFLYPADRKYPQGRLRLVYEAIPLAFMWERAGKGAALINSEGDRILAQAIPEDVHARCGVMYLGAEEADMFAKVRSGASVWGGKPAAQAKKAAAEADKAVASELNMLRAALVVGAIFNVVLMLRQR